MTEIQGRVRHYNSARGYGFISGDDGLDYFFHITSIVGNVDIAKGYRVMFEPGTSEKGPRACRVTVQWKPSQPERFIMTRESEVRGYEVVEVIAEDFWYEAFDPNEAKDGLKNQAIAWGANAIIGLYLEKYSKSPYSMWFAIPAALLGVTGPANYRQTMHRFHGTAVVIRRF